MRKELRGVGTESKSPRYRARVPYRVRNTSTSRIEIPPLSLSRPALLASAPLTALVDELTYNLDALRGLTPNSDSVEMLESIRVRLERAISDAENLDVFVSIATLQRLLGRPQSTLTRICRLHGAIAGAHKVSGRWQVHWPTFEAFITAQPVEEEK
jgi:hypothetical protein